METSFVTCVICPRGCSISVEWENGEEKKVLNVNGYSCARGLKYATAEIVNPERVLTSTVRVKNGSLTLLPIRSATPIPKQSMMDAMKTVSSTIIDVSSSCYGGQLKMGTAVIKNVAGTGVDMIACRDVTAKIC